MTEIASHRGGAQVWPENSPTAFRQTTRLAVEQVEFDVHPSRDGRLVVHHDATLDRTTSGTGPVCDQDWADLARLTLKGTQAERMLLLEEVLLVRLVLVVEVLEYWVKVLQDHRPLVLVMVDLVVLLDHLEIQIMVLQEDCMVVVEVVEMET